MPKKVSQRRFYVPWTPMVRIVDRKKILCELGAAPYEVRIAMGVSAGRVSRIRIRRTDVVAEQERYFYLQQGGKEYAELLDSHIWQSYVEFPDFRISDEKLYPVIKRLQDNEIFEIQYVDLKRLFGM